MPEIGRVVSHFRILEKIVGGETGTNVGIQQYLHRMHENLNYGSFLSASYRRSICCQGASKLAHSWEFVLFEAIIHAAGRT